MSTRAFECIQVEYGDKRVRGVKIVCAKCGHATNTQLGTVDGSPGDQAIKIAKLAGRKFVERGWVVGSVASGDRCPSCASAAQAAQKRTTENQKSPPNVVALKPGPPPHNPVTGEVIGDAPREMRRVDRRLIFEQLNDVYVDEKTGYSERWTDKAVADALGVPRAWVVTVREECFGPAKNEELSKEIAEIAMAVVEARELLARARDLNLDVTEKVGALMPRIDQVASKIDRIERTVLEMRKAVG